MNKNNNRFVTYDKEILENNENAKDNIYNYYSQQPNSVGLYLVYSGHKFYCDPGYLSIPHICDHYLIHYVISGKGAFFANNKSYKLKAGDAFLILPYQLISYQADFDDPWTYYWVGFGGSDVNQLLSLCGLNESNLVFTCSKQEEIKSYFKEIASSRLTQYSQEYFLLGYLYQIFSLIMSDSPKRISTYSDKHYYLATYYIRANLSDSELSVQKIADYVCINRSHLYRIFQDIQHESIQQYILRCRLQKSVVFLTETTYSIGEIAKVCGFLDSAYFSRAFKKAYKMSPLKYRANHSESL